MDSSLLSSTTTNYWDVRSTKSQRSCYGHEPDLAMAPQCASMHTGNPHRGQRTCARPEDPESKSARDEAITRSLNEMRCQSNYRLSDGVVRFGGAVQSRVLASIPRSYGRTLHQCCSSQNDKSAGRQLKRQTRAPAFQYARGTAKRPLRFRNLQPVREEARAELKCANRQ